MIDHEKQILFLHVPKCGGTFLEDGLTPGVDWHVRGEKHLTLSESIDVYGQDVVSACYVFSVVRNPFARLVSAYLYCRRKQLRPFARRGWVGAIPGYRLSQAAYDFAFYRTFRTFVKSLHKRVDTEDWIARNLRPCSAFVKPAGGVSVHDIYRLENISEWLADLSEKTHCTFADTLINASPRKYDYRAFYDRWTIDFVHDYYSEDVKRFYPELDSSLPTVQPPAFAIQRTKA